MESLRSNRSILQLLVTAVTLIGLLHGNTASGQDSTWTDGAGDGLWSSAGNWSLGVPGTAAGDVATFDLATGTAIIDLGGAQTSGGITFTTGAQSFTIGVSGDVLTLSQSANNTRDDAIILMTAGVTNDQTIAADLVLGDGTGTTGFQDQIEIINFSSTNTLFVTGDISTGVGAGAGDVQRLVWGGFNSGATMTEFSGTINETDPATSASRIDMFVGGAELTWGATANVNTTTNNYLRTIIRDDGTLTLVSGSDIGTGLMEVRNGTLNVNSDQTFSHDLTIGQGTQGDTVSINIGSGNTINLDSNLNYVSDDNNANVGTISGGTLQITGGNRNFAINNNSLVAEADAEVIIASNITNDGSDRTITKTGAGTLQLSGTNTYGNTTVSNGLLILSGGSALSDTNLLTVNQNGSSGIVRLDNDETIGSLAGSGTVNLQTNTLTVGDATDTDFSGLFTGTTGGLTKVGTGTLTLSNTGTHTFSGDTNINAGVLNLDGTLSGNVIVSSPGTLAGEGSISGDLTYGSGTYTLDIDASNLDALAVTGQVDTSAPTSITVNVNGTGSGAVTVLEFGTHVGTGLNDIGNFVVGAVANPGPRAVGGFAKTANAITLTLGNVDNTWVGADGVEPTHWVVGSGSGIQNWNNSSDTVFENGDSVIFNDIVGSTTVERQANVEVDRMTFNNTSDVYTLSTATGAESLTINSSVTANNSAAVTIEGPVAVNNGLLLEGAGDLTFSGVVSGSGGLSKNGTGTTTLTTAPTYTGNTNTNEGRLVFSGAAISTASNFNHIIASGATLEYNVPGTGSNNDPTALDVSGAGTFVKTGPGTFSLISSQSDWALASGGLIHIEEGTFSFGGGTPGRWGNNLADMQIDSGAFFEGRSTSIVIDALNGDGTFGVGGRPIGDGTGIGLTLGVDNGDGTFNGVIRNTPANGEDFNLLKVGTGTQNLNGNNTYTGDTTINTGQLNIGGTNVSNFIVGDGVGVETGANLGGEGSTSGSITFTETTHILEVDASTIAALGSTGAGGLDVSDVDVGGLTVNLTGTAATGASGVTVLTYGSGGFTGDVDRFTLGTGAVRAAIAGAFTDDGNGNITVDVGNVTNTWRGGDATNPTFWNVGTTENWSNSADQVFQQGDAAVFDDTAISQTATLQENITAESVTFSNNSKSITVDAAGSEILTVANGITANGGAVTRIDSGVSGVDNGIIFDGTGDLTVGGVISGTGGLTKNGTGTVTLDNANSFTGTVNVNAGTLAFTTNAITGGSTANNTAVIANGATLEFDDGGIGRSIDTFDHGGGGTFLKKGSSQFNQTSASSDITYTATGLIHVAEGRYQFGGGTPGNWQSNLGSLQVDAGANFDGRNTSIFIDALNGGGLVEIGGNGTRGVYGLTLGVSDGDGLFTGVIQNTNTNTGAGGVAATALSVNKVGTGRQALEGNNTYTGETVISDGTLILNGSLGGNITIASGAAIGGSASTTGTITFADGTSIVEVNGAEGPLTTTEGTTGLDLTGVTAGGITVEIASGGPGEFVILDYGGVATGFTAGSGASLFTLAPGGPAASGRGGGSGVIVDNSTAITFDLGYEVRTWSATNTGNWTNGADDNNWIEGADFDYFDGDSVVFTENAVVTGAPTTNQTISLTTNVAPSEVDFTNDTISYIINSAGSETITPTTDINVTGAGNVTINAPIAGDIGINKSGGGTLTLGGANTFTGPITVSGGTFTFGADNAVADTVAITHTGGNINFLNGVVDTIGSVNSTAGTFFLGINNSSGTADLTLNGDSFINNLQIGTQSFLRTAANTEVGINGISQLGTNHSLTINVGANSVVEVTGSINGGNGPGALDKSGSGTLRVTNPDSAWGGGTRITGGVLEFTSISDKGNTGDINDSSLGNAENVDILQIGSDTTAATLRMIGNDAKNFSDRAVQLGDAGGTIDVQEATQTLTLNGVVSNDTVNGGTSGSLTKAGAGTLVLASDNTYSGTTTISDGVLQVGTGTADGSLGNLAADVINNAALVLNVSDNNDYSGNISGTGTLTHSGSGVTTLSGTNTYTGGTAVTDGTLIIAGDSSGVTGGTTVASGATLAGSGTLGGDTQVSGTLVAGVNLGTTGETLTLTGDLSATSGATWLVDLNNAVSGESDLIALGDITTRTIDLTNFNLSLNDFGTFNLSTGFTYDIATYTDTGGPLTSTFAGLANGSQINGSTGQYIITYGNQDGFGGDNYSIRLTAVPEPTSFLLLLPLLLAGFYLARRRKLQQTAATEA